MTIIRFGLDNDPMPLPKKRKKRSDATGRDPEKRRAVARRASKKYYWAHREKELARRKRFYERFKR